MRERGEKQKPSILYYLRIYLTKITKKIIAKRKTILSIEKSNKIVSLFS